MRRGRSNELRRCANTFHLFQGGQVTPLPMPVGAHDHKQGKASSTPYRKLTDELAASLQSAKRLVHELQVRELSSRRIA